MPRRSDATTRSVRPAQQERSRQSEDALVRATRELLRDSEFDGITVADIVAAAGLSVGGFYARFRDKDALLEVLNARLLDEIQAAFDRAMDAVASPEHGASEVVAAYVRVMVREFRRHRREIVQVRRFAGQGTHRGSRARVRAFNDHVHGRLRALLTERLDAVTHPSPALAVDFGLFVVSAAAREATLTDSLRAYPVQLDEAALTAELTRAYLAYLGLAAPETE